MPSTSPFAILPFPATLSRGIHFELYGGHRIYFAVDSRGIRLPFVGVPIGLETERDVVGRLMNSLAAADPQPRVSSGRRGIVWLGEQSVDRPVAQPPVPARVLRLVRPAPRALQSR